MRRFLPLSDPSRPLGISGARKACAGTRPNENTIILLVSAAPRKGAQRHLLHRRTCLAVPPPIESASSPRRRARLMLVSTVAALTETRSPILRPLRSAQPLQCRHNLRRPFRHFFLAQRSFARLEFRAQQNRIFSCTNRGAAKHLDRLEVAQFVYLLSGSGLPHRPKRNSIIENERKIP